MHKTVDAHPHLQSLCLLVAFLADLIVACSNSSKVHRYTSNANLVSVGVKVGTNRPVSQLLMVVWLLPSVAATCSRRNPAFFRNSRKSNVLTASN